MALPVTILSDNGVSGYSPPWKSSAGEFYIVIFESAATPLIDVYKATDPTDSFTAQDTGNHPTFGAGTPVQCLSVTQKGDVLYLCYSSGSSDQAYTYGEFDMAADTWSVINQTIDATTNDPTFPWISIAVRSDGDVVVVYAGDLDANMGDNKERVDVNIRTGTTWGGPVALDAGGDIHYGNPNCVLGTSDGVHIQWWRQPSTTEDPPIAWNYYQSRTLNSSDSLSTVVNNTNNNNPDHLLTSQNMVTYDDGGTQRIISNWIFRDADHDIVTGGAVEDGSDNISSPTSSTEGIEQDLWANGEVSILSCQELSTDLHLLYSGGGTAGVDQDLYYTKSTNNGVTWDAPTEEIDAITVNFISANIFVRGGNTVMGYVYDDAGAQKYNEKVLIAGAAFLPFHAQRTNVLLRM